MQRATDGGRGAHAHAKRAHHVAILLHERTGQAELGDTVLQHTADLGPLLKYRDGTAQLGHLNGHGNTSGTGTDHSNLFTARRCGLPLLTIQICRGDIVLDAREMHRRALAAPMHAPSHWPEWLQTMEQTALMGLFWNSSSPASSRRRCLNKSMTCGIGV